MGALDLEKKSRKRKADKISDASSPVIETRKSMRLKTPIKSPQIDATPSSPDQKSAKKRKINKQEDSLKEKGNQIETIPTEKQIDSHDEDASLTKKKRAEKMAAAQVEDSSTPKKKKKFKKVKTEEEEEEEENVSTEKNELEIEASENQEAEDGNGTPSEKKKKKKKKKKPKKKSFGVVDMELLEKSGGDSSMDDATDKSNAQPSRINRAIEYLHQWKTNKKSWKFKKNLNSLLLRAVYNPVIVPDDTFEILLLYFQNSQGISREKLKEDALALIKEDDHLAEPVDPDKEKRAREILQMLG